MFNVVYSDSEITRDKIKQNLEDFGMCIVDNVLDGEQLSKALDLTWEDLKCMSPNLDRYNKETWTPSNRPDDNGGMIQSMAGWTRSQMFVRTHSVKVYELLYGTDKLNCSADGMTFSGLLKHRRKKPSKKVHFDAGEGNISFVVQGVVNLVEQNEGDACFGCFPGSHKLHNILAKGPKNWYRLTEENINVLEENGLKYTRFHLKAGSMVLFRSQLAHCQAHPINVGVEQKPRIVHYICALPICTNKEDEEKTIKMKLKAYSENRATTHYPNYSLSNMRLFPRRLGNGIIGRYKRDVSRFNKANRMPIEEMSARTKQLMGLEFYLT